MDALFIDKVENLPLSIAFMKGRFERLIKIDTDTDYCGELIKRPKTKFVLILEIVLKSDHFS